MSCFPCFLSKSKKSMSKREHLSANGENVEATVPETKKQKPGNIINPETNQVETGNINAKTFTFRELATATKNFRQECLLGEGGFGRVYKGTLASNGQVVAVKQLDRNGMLGNKEFLKEVAVLSLVHHSNLVNLIGYCADGDQRLLVYEFISGGSLEDHVLEMTPEKQPFGWFTRMQIAFGAAKGLEYLHDKANPPVIFRDLKPSNILLDEDLNPKLSDYGLTKLGPAGDQSMLGPSRVMGTYGYCAPEYQRSSELSLKSDVYSFGVVLLELISGRRAVDTTRPVAEQNLVTWAQPIFRDPKRYGEIADPLLRKQFPERSLNQAVAIASMCLQEEPSARPLISDIVTALSFLSMATEDPLPPPTPPSGDQQNNGSEDEESDDEHNESSRKSSVISMDDESDSSSGHLSFPRHKSSKKSKDGSSSSSSHESSMKSDSGSDSSPNSSSRRSSLSHNSSRESQNRTVH